MLFRFQQFALFALICFAMHSSVHAQFGIQNPLKGIGGSLNNGINDTFKGAGQIVTESIKVAPGAIVPGLQVPDKILDGRGYGLNPNFRLPNPVMPSPVMPSPVMPSPVIPSPVMPRSHAKPSLAKHSHARASHAKSSHAESSLRWIGTKNHRSASTQHRGSHSKPRQDHLPRSTVARRSRDA